MCANASLKEIESLKSFGTNFGMCFQLIDDAIDYSSSNVALGKNNNPSSHYYYLDI